MVQEDFERGYIEVGMARMNSYGTLTITEH